MTSSKIQGMTQCPGLVARLKLEMNGVKVNFSVDEHLQWKAVCSDEITEKYTFNDTL
jgi:hypothetical protein